MERESDYRSHTSGASRLHHELENKTVSPRNSVTEQDEWHQIATGVRTLRRTEGNSAKLELRGEFRSDKFRIRVALANVETLVGVAKLDG